MPTNPYKEMIEELPDIQRFPETEQEMMWDKINELAKAINRLQRP